MAITQLQFTFVDHSKEQTKVTFYVAEVAADGSNWDDLVTDVASVRALSGAAINAITGLNEIRSGVSVPDFAETAVVYPAYGHDRELAVRFIYQDDTTGTLYRFDIPDPVDIFSDNSDEVDMSNALVIALKAIVDADWVSPAGNACTLLRGYKVGRNN
jgi:hypothetical protein